MGIVLVIKLRRDFMGTNIFTKFDEDQIKYIDIESGNPNF